MTATPMPSPAATRVHGYCSLSEAEIAGLVARGRARDVINAHGDFAITVESEGTTTLIASAFGATQYYYAVVDGELHHGTTVLGVVESAGIPWRWDWATLATVAELEYPLADDTLHADVTRLPSRSVLTFTDGRPTVERVPWEELLPEGHATPADTLRGFNEETARWLNDDAVLSISGGLDSRVLLSALLKAGSRPHCVVMGPPESTDARLSAHLCDHYRLSLERIAFGPKDYLEVGAQAARLTSGTKPAKHWHTLIYSSRAGLPKDGPFFVGNAGEFLRTFLLDGGLPVTLLDRTGFDGARWVWKHRRRIRGRVFHAPEAHHVRPELSQQLFGSGAPPRHGRLEDESRRSRGLLGGLDRYYLEHQVRNFGGNGLKLYSASTQWIAPFVSLAFARPAWNLEQRWKLGSRWHRWALRENDPWLLTVPESEGRTRTPLEPRPFYYIPSKKHKAIPYADYGTFFRDPVILDYIRDHAQVLDALVDPAHVRRICDQHARSGDRLFAVSFLLLMSFFVPQTG